MNKPNMVPDYPDADGTDNAHPAWWRGQEDGVIGTVIAINRVLDEIESGNQHTGTFGNKALEELRTRLHSMYAGSN